MNIITVDFETYYDREFSLSKMTTEEYVRGETFEVIGVGVSVGAGDAMWFSGTHKEVKAYLDNFDWANSFVLAHNTQVDGAILSWLFGVKPKGWLDTLCMARALHGMNAGGSLKALAERYEIGEKGTEVLNALGKRRVDFTEEELAKYGDYCKNDVELTRTLFGKLVDAGFPMKELKVIDVTLRMYIEPTLELNTHMLEEHLQNVKERKAALLESAEVDKDMLMSNDKFAELLTKLGVKPPRKISARTGKEAWAFAKTDEEFKVLLEHVDPRVQILVSARLGNKTTLEETRTQRFIDIGYRGKLPVPIKYYAAHTGRWGGDDKINLQNLPSRGQNANKLKKSIMAPDGYVVIDSDSSQIEARTVAWLAGQTDLVEAFQNGEDVYKIMASAIYGKGVDEITKDERFVGKTTILGCISEGTLVLSDSGWKPIEQVVLDDKLWDGGEWVCHQGLQNSGIKETLNLCGIWLTPDHKVWSGTQWLEAQFLVQDASTRSQALDTAAENLPLQATFADKGEAFLRLSSSVTADLMSTAWTTITSKISEARAVRFVPKLLQTKNGTGCIRTQWQTTGIEPGFSIDWLLPSQGATLQPTRHTSTMGGGVYQYGLNGEKTELPFFGMYKQLKAGISRVSRWTGLMSTKDTSPAIFDSSPEATTSKTNEKSQTLSRRLQTYDLAYAGPKNRYMVLTAQGPMIVHNCGYGMGAAKFQAQLKTFGQNTTLEECQRIISVYRSTYAKIPELWKQGNNCLEAIITKRAASFGVVDAVKFDAQRQGFLLPSGLWQRYEGLKKLTRDNKTELVYQTRKGETKMYGGKLVENLCQAVARCVIAEQMLRISKKYHVVLTVHDAVACIAPAAEAKAAQEYVEECMRWRPDWASTLPLNCESGMGTSYGDC